MVKPKFILISTISLFGIIGLVSLFKSSKSENLESPTKIMKHHVEQIPIPTTEITQDVMDSEEPEPIRLEEISNELPEIDRIAQLFAIDSSKLPIVETVTYTSRVPWLKGRPAWIADYASHYATSRHFIARSLNHKPDYFTQSVAPGDRFNVLRKDLNIEFYLLIDVSKCKLWFYCLDKEANERVLLKTYNVGVGRKEAKRKSGFLTPAGTYSLGNKIAIYKEGTKGYFQDQKIEMIQVFGTRWIPFDKEVKACTESAKGYGIHGSPWVRDPTTGELVEDRSHICKYDGDGCIRLNSEDIEEIFSIIITKPTTVEIVNNFKEADSPGTEKNEFSWAQQSQGENR